MTSYLYNLMISYFHNLMTSCFHNLMTSCFHNLMTSYFLNLLTSYFHNLMTSYFHNLTWRINFLIFFSLPSLGLFHIFWGFNLVIDCAYLKMLLLMLVSLVFIATAHSYGATLVRGAASLDNNITRQTWAKTRLQKLLLDFRNAPRHTNPTTQDYKFKKWRHPSYLKLLQSRYYCPRVYY